MGLSPAARVQPFAENAYISQRNMQQQKLSIAIHRFLQRCLPAMSTSEKRQLSFACVRTCPQNRGLDKLKVRRFAGLDQTTRRKSTC